MGRRQKLLVTLDTLLDVQHLHARSSTPARSLIALIQIDPRFAALRIDLAADRAVACDLRVAVVGIAGPHPDLAKQSAEGDLGARIISGVMNIDVGRFGLDRWIERIANGNAIEGGVVRDRSADVEAAVKISQRAGSLE